jgi:small subunit ribosomal protein S6
MKKYEFVFVVKPDLSSPKIKKTLTDLKKEIEKAGGKIEKENDWGQKTLAYPIGKYQQGGYFLWQLSFDQNPSFKSLDVFLMRQDEVIRHLMVKVSK